MRIHDTLQPLRGVTQERRQLIEDAVLIGDGAYSRVLARNPYSVVKLTSCKTTKKLLDNLSKLPKSAYPHGLPAVMETWGPAARDADGQTFHGFVVERLFSPADVAKRLRAKRTGFDVVNKYRKVIDSKYLCVAAEMDYLRDALAAARDRCLTGERETFEEHLDMANQLATMRLPLSMEKTFAFLGRFIRTCKGELDLFTSGNILVDMCGAPVLADPVAEQTDVQHAQATLKKMTGPRRAGYALVVKLLTKVHGATGACHWDTVAVSDDKTALAGADPADVLPPGVPVLESRVVIQGSAAHTRLIAQGVSTPELWTLPRAAVRLATRKR
jgi:hypothetical protein